MPDVDFVAADINRIRAFTDEVFPVQLAVTVTAGQILYQLATGTYGLADANDAGRQQARGIALQGGAAGEVIDMLVRGWVTGYTLTGIDYDAILYLSDTAGDLSEGAGTMTVYLARVGGVPLSNLDLTKAMFFNAEWATVWA